MRSAYRPARDCFIHEMAHVWASIRKAYSLLLRRHPFCRYDYSLKPGWKLERYGLEQQAEIIKHIFLLRNGREGHGRTARLSNMTGYCLSNGATDPAACASAILRPIARRRCQGRLPILSPDAKPRPILPGMQATRQRQYRQPNSQIRQTPSAREYHAGPRSIPCATACAPSTIWNNAATIKKLQRQTHYRDIFGAVSSDKDRD